LTGRGGIFVRRHARTLSGGFAGLLPVALTLTLRRNLRLALRQGALLPSRQRSRAAPSGATQESAALFLCDEYQQICSAGDAQFFDTSRVLGVIGIVASQSIDAYIAAIDNEHAATALLGNFTNVIAFRSTEPTIDYVPGKLRNVDVWKKSYNTSRTTRPTLLFQRAASVSEGHSASPAATASHLRANLSCSRMIKPSRC